MATDSSGKIYPFCALADKFVILAITNVKKRPYQILGLEKHQEFLAPSTSVTL